MAGVNHAAHPIIATGRNMLNFKNICIRSVRFGRIRLLVFTHAVFFQLYILRPLAMIVAGGRDSHQPGPVGYTLSRLRIALTRLVDRRAIMPIVTEMRVAKCAQMRAAVCIKGAKLT